MKIEKLNENKIRIFLNLDDLKEKDIDLHTFMSNSIETQKIFLDMLEKAEKEVGFKTDNYRIIIEAIALSSETFVLTVTKLKKEIDSEKTTYKKVHIKRKTANLTKNDYIYCFSSFEDFYNFCNIFSKEPLMNKQCFCENCSLYLYKQEYYLILSNMNFSLDFTKKFFNNIVEYASLVHDTKLFKGKLQEYGEMIISENAINICLKYF